MQWLKELQEDRRKVDEKKKIEEQHRLKRRSEFKEREAKKRLHQKTYKESEALCDEDADDNEENSLSPLPPQCTTTPSMKPAWCQSEAANESAQEMAEINDEADLLDFVHDLDFDQYDKDLELQALIGQVKERIKKLEREKKKDETTLQACVDVSNSLLSEHVVRDCVVATESAYLFISPILYLLLSSYRVKLQRLELKNWIAKWLSISYPLISTQTKTVKPMT